MVMVAHDSSATPRRRAHSVGQGVRKKALKEWRSHPWRAICAPCCPPQSLLARAIKHEERKKNIEGARELLARLKHVGIDKVRP
jgi:hypothetical protein